MGNLGRKNCLNEQEKHYVNKKENGPKGPKHYVNRWQKNLKKHAKMKEKIMQGGQVGGGETLDYNIETKYELQSKICQIIIRKEKRWRKQIE